MKRQSCTRCLLNMMGWIVPATLAAGLLLTPATIPAQSNSKTTQAPKAQEGKSRAAQLTEEARRELKKENFGAARELLEKARAADPKAPGLDQLAKDIAAAEQKAAENKRSAEVQGMLKSARASLKDRQYGKALDSVSMALEKEPSNAEAKKLRTEIVEAEKASRTQAAEGAVKARITAARTAIRAKNFDQARRHEAEAREAAKGMFADDLQRLAADIAAGEANLKAEQNKDRIANLLDRADRQLKENQFDSARASVNEVLQIDRQNKKASSMLAKVGAAEKKFIADRSQREAARALEAAESLLKAEKYDEAEAAYAAILKTDSNNKAARRGVEDARAGKLAAKSRNAERLAREGLVAARAGNMERANTLLAQAKELDPSNRQVAALQQEVNKAQATKTSAEAKVAADKKAAEEKLAAAQKAAADKQAADEKKAAEARQAADAKAAAEKKAAEEKAAAAQKAAEDKKAAEAKQLADAKAAAEKKAADEKKAAEARQAADAKAAAEKKAAEEKAAAAQKAAEDKKAAEAKQLADAKAAAEKKAADEKKAAEARQAADAKAAAEKKAAEEEAAAKAAAPVAAVVAVSQSEPEPASAIAQATTPAATATPTPTPTITPAATRTPDAARAAAAEEAARRQAEREAQEAQRTAERQREQESRERRRQASAAHDEAVRLYGQKNLAAARQRWLDAKELDPTFTPPDAFLQNTEKEYNEFLAKQAAASEFERREGDAVEKLATPITISTTEPMVLSEFLSNLRLLSGIDFVVAGQVNAKIEAAFEDVPLRQVLNSTLLPIGLTWRREPGSSTVIVEPDLRTEVFTATPAQLNTVESLIRDGVIGRLLYGPSGQAVLQGQEVYTDPRQNIVIMTDSSANLEKFRRFLENLKGQQGTQLIIDTYEIDERRAPEIKALLSALLAADNDAPYNVERKLILEGSTLIVKDTPQNIQKVREILQDQNFLRKFYQEELNVATFNLTPVVEFEDNPDLVRQFADNVRQVVETLLYAKGGRSNAEREGRRLWYDPATLQLTVVDYPDRLQTVQNYIESIPAIRSRRRSKIIFLDHATASTLVAQLERFLGISPDPVGGGSSSGNQLTRSAGRNDEIEFNGAFFRVRTINENDAADENDDSVEIVVRTGTTSQTVTIEEFLSEFVDDYEIVVDDIRPSGTAGDGRVRLTIRYIPGGQSGTGGLSDEDRAAQEQAAQDRSTVRQETGLSIVDIENLNAIFVQYNNIEDLREVEFWVRTLDIPTLQVSIEIKFVEVVTNKAKELKPDFVISDLTEGFTLDDSVLRSRFAQDRDEYQSAFDPIAETQGSANLLKGSTVFNFILNNGNSPISFQLRVLEAQGLINVVNGPTVTVLNTETADFLIEREFGLRQPVAGSTGGGTSNDTNLTAVATLTPVDLSITPNVTRAGNITLDIDVEMRDEDQNLGQLVSLAAPPTTGDGTVVTTTASPTAFVNPRSFAILRKQLTTQARIPDGGTVVLGGWRSERTQDLESGIPILRDIPFIGKYFFERMSKNEDKINLLIFLTGQVVRD